MTSGLNFQLVVLVDAAYRFYAIGGKLMEMIIDDDTMDHDCIVEGRSKNLLWVWRRIRRCWYEWLVCGEIMSGRRWHL
jgi:hypothetical protein